MADGAEVRSKVLFGNRHMLDVSRSIANGGRVLLPRDLCASLGLPASSVHRTLEALVAAGLLERGARTANERNQPYVRVDHPFWDAARRLCEEAGRG